MNLVDSCGWIEYVAGTKLGRNYIDPINKISSLLVPSICIYEVFKKIAHERDEEEALSIVANMQMGQIAELDSRLAIDAAQISREHKLPMADAIVLATGRAFGATIWTQDSHLKGFPGVKYFSKHDDKDVT